jgi:hypothetical protein
VYGRLKVYGRVKLWRNLINTAPPSHLLCLLLHLAGTISAVLYVCLLAHGCVRYAGAVLLAVSVAVVQ